MTLNELNFDPLYIKKSRLSFFMPGATGCNAGNTAWK